MRRLIRVAAAVVCFAVSASLAVEAQGWTTSTSEDEMTGEVQAFATSARTSPSEGMGFPYQGVVGWLAVGCDAQDEWAYIGFSESPNLTNTETHDGYDSFRTRVRWDDNVTRMRFTQEWGERFLHFRPYDSAIENMRKAHSVLVELDWYGSGEVYFEFSLSGSAEAIAEAREICRAP